MTINKKRVAIIGTVAAVAISGTGVAYAFFTSTGTGAGSAQAGTSVAWEITNQATDTSNGPLTPGGPTQTASFTVKNNGTGVQKLTQVVVSIQNSNNTPWTPAGCSAADFAFNGATSYAAVTLPSGASIAPGAESSPFSIDIQMLNSTSNQDGCKNVSVPLYYAAS